ncbi:MAG: rhodanese-like domain-containing protein [Eubacteriaceae bacterium]
MQITHKKAKEMIDSFDVVIIDVRTEEEFDKGHIKNAVLIPHYELHEKVNEIVSDKNKTILIYCQNGIRSSAAEKLLMYIGYKNVYDFGGINDWPYGIDK